MAQKKFDGYYTTAANDTVWGQFEKFKQWDVTPDSVYFRRPDGSGIMLTPRNCKSFTISNYETYLAYTGKRMTNPYEFTSDFSERDSASRFTAVAVFLRVAYSDKIYKLLVLNDGKRKNYFLQTGNQLPQELLIKIYLDNDSKLNEKNLFRDQLMQIFYAGVIDKKLTKVLEMLPYQEESIRQFLARVNGDGTIKQERNKKYPAELVITAGIAINNFKYNNDVSNRKVTYEANISPVIGFGAIFHSQRNFGKLFVFPHIRFFKYKSTGTNTYNADHKIRTTFQADFIINPGMFAGYNFINNPKIKCYLETGVSIYLYGSHKKTKEIIFNYTSPPVINTEEEELPGFAAWVNAQAGISFKDKYVLFINYCPPLSVANLDFPAKRSDLQLGLHWKFKMKK